MHQGVDHIKGLAIEQVAGTASALPRIPAPQNINSARGSGDRIIYPSRPLPPRPMIPQIMGRRYQRRRETVQTRLDPVQFTARPADPPQTATPPVPVVYDRTTCPKPSVCDDFESNTSHTLGLFHGKIVDEAEADTGADDLLML